MPDYIVRSVLQKNSPGFFYAVTWWAVARLFHWVLSHHGPCLRSTGCHGHLVLLGNLWGPFFRVAEKWAKKEGSREGRNPPRVGLWLSRLLRSAPQALPAAAASAHSSSAESESTSDSDSSSDSESESSSSDSEENEPREAPAPEVLVCSGRAVDPRWPRLPEGLRPGGGAFRPPCTLLAIRVYLFLGVGLWNFGRDVFSPVENDRFFPVAARAVLKSNALRICTPHFLFPSFEEKKNQKSFSVGCHFNINEKAFWNFRNAWIKSKGDSLL